ncbi:MAG TPA: hypothetical protein VJO35_15130 [Terriglobales bacterium]|nr:hypothetical protein [Terriglobales bacterium]
MSKPAKLNFVQSLIAVLAGNLVYFLLMPHLPAAAQHNPMRLDLGVLVDFWFCLVFLGALKTFWKPRQKSNPQERH